MGSHISDSEWYEKELDEQLFLNIPLDTELHLWVSETCRKLNLNGNKNGHNERKKNVFFKACITVWKHFSR